jgi:hypothetical protein
MYPKDGWYLKLLVGSYFFSSALCSMLSILQVAAVLTFDTIHQMLITHTSALTFYCAEFF